MMNLWLSIHPRWAEEILSGAKSVELRRRAPRVAAGATALVYVTTPVRALVASAAIEDVVTLPLRTLWSAYGSRAAVTKKEFDGYFRGQQYGVAITLGQVTPLENEVPLSTLRDHGESPAQGWRYVSRKSTELLLVLGA